MRVTAGSAKGRNLKSPEGTEIRPTLSRIKEAMFSMIYSHFGRDAQGAVADLYAGCGALGIEALSRGASHCTFIDNSPAAIMLINENLEGTKLKDRARVKRATLPQGMETLKEWNLGVAFEVIFCDPPYGATSKSPAKTDTPPTSPEIDNPSAAILAAVEAHGLLQPDGLLIVQVGKYLALPERCGRLQKIKEKLYGETSVQIYSNKV